MHQLKLQAAHIHLVRHGEVHNPGGVLYGRLPHFHLSEKGKKMAVAAAKAAFPAWSTSGIQARSDALHAFSDTAAYRKSEVLRLDAIVSESCP